ncbi:relaxase/mobilization nuclease domain-containing protein [Faecalibaculum rodentium]|uniref:relaxase/mobilization nuclease domain-containing protein n=1 Tax=Faecalibaculum rodentium TaxID=1702221 RepID=UPI0023F1AE5F|nr:relaxase/mobilization nuclease domain-containing protein [Faecalibaculum rodentium]
MPYAKRIVVHGKSGLANCISYVKNDEKTLWLESGINCSPEFAFEQMRSVQKKFRIPAGMDDRSGYHIIQSFYEDDPVSPEQVHEIGVGLCRKLYPQFQSLVCTHQDKFHLHNHIVVNVCDLSGRKLVDRLADKKEGLYGLLHASEELGKRYGCHPMKKERVSMAKTKNYSGILYSMRKPSQASLLTKRLNELKDACWSVEELMSELAADGWKISRNQKGDLQYLGPEGKRSIPEKRLPTDLTLRNLEIFFDCKCSVEMSDAGKMLMDPEDPVSELTRELFAEMARSSRILEIIHDQQYMRPEKLPDTVTVPLMAFRDIRYKEIKRRNRLSDLIGFCHQNGVIDRTDLAAKVILRHTELHQREKELLKADQELEKLERSRADNTSLARAKRHCNWLYYRICFLKEQVRDLDELQLKEHMETEAVSVIDCRSLTQDVRAQLADPGWQLTDGRLCLSRAALFQVGSGYGKLRYKTAAEIESLILDWNRQDETLNRDRTDEQERMEVMTETDINHVR